MDQPIVVKYRWSADDLIQAYRYHWRQSCRPIFRFGLHFLFAMSLLGGAIGCFEESGGSLVFPIACVLVGIYWFAIRPFGRRWIVRRQYAKRHDKDIEMAWVIAPDNISVQSCIGHLEFSWEAVVKVLRTPSGLMLYSLEQLFHYLPRRGFASDTEFERAVDLAKSKVRRFYRVA
jgi:hypothetical protein